MTKKKNIANREIMQAGSVSPLAEGVSTFTFDSTDGAAMPVRVLTDKDGEPWFVASDIAKPLGYRMASDMTRRLNDDEKDTRSVRTLGGTQQMTVISESGLYAAILGSKVEGAQRFQRWVTHDVLPSIRKTGMYATQQTMDMLLHNPDAIYSIVTQWHDALQENQRQARQLQEQAPKVEAYDGFLNVPGTLTVRDTVKILNNNGLTVREKEFRRLLGEWGWAYKPAHGHWTPTAYASTEHDWLVLVPCKSHGMKKDGEPFSFPPVMRVEQLVLKLST